MLGSYRATLALLDRHANAIARVFSELPGFETTPIRVCLRGTGDYVRARTEPLWPPLLPAEREQLDRGDIPYFFQLYGSPGIHYYTNPSLTALGTLPKKGDVPQPMRLLNVARAFRSPSRRKLRDEGQFTLLGAFDHPSFSGVYENEALKVRFSKRSLILTFPDGEELEARRDLRAFVSSVYLPCRCGEVESVFVPPVTVCDACPR